MRTNRALTKNTVTTYAGVILEAVSGEDRIFELLKQLKSVVSAITGHKNLSRTLADDRYPNETKIGILTDLFTDIPKELESVLSVMIERGELELLGDLAVSLEGLIQKKLDITVVYITTAIPLDDALRSVIQEKLATEYGTRIHLEESVDPSIIGGIIMSALGKRIDASITAQLRNARLVLTTDTTGGEG